MAGVEIVGTHNRIDLSKPLEFDVFKKGFTKPDFKAVKFDHFTKKNNFLNSIFATIKNKVCRKIKVSM